MTLLARLVAAADDVAATSSRTAKRDRLAALLAGLDPDEVVAAVGFLTGEPRQGRVGVGWATLSGVSGVSGLSGGGAVEPSLVVADVDRLLDDLAATSGPGSGAARLALIGDLLGRATDAEAGFVRRLLLGELRQGALEGVMVDAVARAAGVPVTAVRRAAMLSGDLRRTAAVALGEGRPGLDRITLAVGRPVQPMLAATSQDVAAAVDEGGGEASVEWKLDGARVQIHRVGPTVRVFTRNLNDVTSRLPGVVAAARALPAERLVLDGEVLAVRADERPTAFQDTMSRFGRQSAGGATTPVPDEAVTALTDGGAADGGAADDGAPDDGAAGDGAGAGAALEAALERDPSAPGAAVPATAAAAGVELRPFLFDVLHVDGQDLIDEPLRERLGALADVAGPLRVPGIVTADPAQAAAFLDEALRAGHEGVMVKGLDSPYQAGRRGRAWRKVKPVRLFDLVVLAAEWGSGRRRGWLSNLHLGARDPAGGGFVMVGKTFKGLTDELLAWQTAALQERSLGQEGHVVHVRPELVVEIALDGVQASTRYPGGVALRFARVRRYRTDKDPAGADTIEALQALLPGR